MISEIEQEFETVDMILRSDARTKGVDAFCLTWIKFERQLRKLTEVYCTGPAYYLPAIERPRKLYELHFWQKTNIKHDNFLGGIRRLTRHTMKDIIGDRHKEFRRAVNQV